MTKTSTVIALPDGMNAVIIDGERIAAPVRNTHTIQAIERIIKKSDLHDVLFPVTKRCDNPGKNIEIALDTARWVVFQLERLQDAIEQGVHHEDKEGKS